MPPANSPTDAPATSGFNNINPRPARRPTTYYSLPESDITTQHPFPSQTEDDVESQNISFLRTPYNPEEAADQDRIQRESDQERRQVALDVLSRTLRDERQERRRRSSRPSNMTSRMQGMENTLRAVGNPVPSEERLHAHFETLQTQQAQDQARAPYGTGVPERQTMYDWAPNSEEAELERILSSLREVQPNTHPEVLRALARSHLSSLRTLSRHHPQPTLTPSQILNQRTLPPTLHMPRSEASIRDVRRNSALTTRSRDLMARYVMERDRDREEGVPETAERNRTSPSRANFRTALNDTSRYELNRIAWQASQRSTTHHSAGERESLDSLRRRYLENPPHKTTEFERIIKYLHNMRNSDVDDTKMDDIEGFEMEKPQAWTSADRLNMKVACPPHPTSWLVPGMTFTGTQHAAHSPNLMLRQPSHPNQLQHHNPSNFDASRPWLTQTSDASRLSFTQPQNLTPFLSTSPTSSDVATIASPDRWVVKVSLHNVDYDNMTLQGTMEAFNVSSNHSCTTSANADNTGKTTFSTYLTGELLDFHRYTLLTVPTSSSSSLDDENSPLGPNIRTTADIDARYWRKLEPFASLSEDEIARVLLDPHWIDREISQKYVLMRWKERCFVKPTYEARAGVWNEGTRPDPPSEQSSTFMPGVINTAGLSATERDQSAGPDGGMAGLGRQFGLSISGFYYVSLRRSDGRLEGLYFDPQSSPYQHLELRPDCRGLGRWGVGASEVL